MMNSHGDAGESSRLGPRAFWLRPGVVAGVATLALDVGWINDTRGDGFSERDLLVAALLGLAAASGILGTAMPIARIRGVALAWTAGVLLSIGALSLSSIGVPLIVAGVLAASAMLSTVGYGAPRRTVVAVAGSLLAAFVIVFLGVLLTR